MNFAWKGPEIAIWEKVNRFLNDSNRGRSLFRFNQIRLLFDFLKVYVILNLMVSIASICSNLGVQRVGASFGDM